ncbi:M56 family metallopeptidase [Flavobacterium sp. CSZ]|uniref:M56 family metallopeptidase n=1 Tax=Flavobacterium sp. CSZ TaxID=2783791 RepID=UPI001889C718|nr:M56 family metallopeptidase [Flavobacterium sp. CSZ]MBF4488234.1 energy transducer TonB [Flavobacterium sp. CSZ]
MIDFFIKSTIALSVFLIFYHLILEREKMHQFNRFFLLGSLLISFVLPFVTIEIIQEVSNSNTENLIIPGQITAKIVDVDKKTPFYVVLGWTIYGLVTTILFFRFITNLYNLINKGKINNVLEYQNAKLVLLQEKTLPYTFLSTIFINEMDYQNKKIEKELFTHELIHVNQKHSLDILFIEIIKIVFWFNPIFIFYKKAIQLNHEFLADDKVITSHKNVSFYQNLLLSKANQGSIYYLASNLNYSVTKKRLIMMTTTTSKKITFLKKTALLPIMAILVFFLCIETVAQKSKTDAKTEGITNVSNIEKYYANTVFVFKEDKASTATQKKYAELTESEKKRIPLVLAIPAKVVITKNMLEKFKDESKYAVWVDGINIVNSNLNQYKENDFVYYYNSFVYKNARGKKFPQENQVSLYTNKGFENAFEKNKNEGPKMIEITGNSKKRKSDQLVKMERDQDKESLVKSESEIQSNNSIEKQPEFPGGMPAFYKFIGKNFKIPEEASKNKIQGKIVIEFMVEKDGTLSEFKILKDLGYGIGEEAIKILKLSPAWNPGSEMGKPVRVLYTLPITIQDNETPKKYKLVKGRYQRMDFPPTIFGN